MKLSDKECKLIMQTYKDIIENKCNKYDGLKIVKEANIKVSQASYYKILASLELLQILKENNVDDYVIDKVAQQLKLFHIWRLYND